MAAPPQPPSEPGSDPTRLPPHRPATQDEVVAAATAVIQEYQQTRPIVARALDQQAKDRRQRWWLLAIIGGFCLAFLAAALIFGGALLDVQSVANQNSQLIERLSADEASHHTAINCLDDVLRRQAQINRRTQDVARRSREALDRLLHEVKHAASTAQFDHDIDAYHQAVKDANAVPVPPLPPPACR